MPPLHPTSSRPARIRWRRAFAAACIALVATAALGMSAAASTVEIAVDGDVHAVRTFGGTVADALARAEVELGPHDAVSLDPSDAVVDDVQVEVVRAITVELVVLGDEPIEITAPVRSVAGAIVAADLSEVVAGGAAIVPPLHAPVSDGDRITVQLPVDVTIAVDGTEREVATLSWEVGAILDEAGVDVGGDDLVTPALDAPVTGPATITVQRVEFVEEVIEVELDHDEVRQETDAFERGETRTDQEGVPGLRRDTYEVTVVDGEERHRERVEEHVVEEPVDEVVLVGTKAPPPPPPPSPPSTPAPRATSSTDGVWDRLAGCESGGNWSAVSANGQYYGGLQFHPSTWRNVGGSGMPHQASRAEQITRGKILQQRSGWGQWPHCSRALGLR